MVKPRYIINVTFWSPPKPFSSLSPSQPPVLRFPANHNYYNLFIPDLFRAGIDMEDFPAR